MTINDKVQTGDTVAGTSTSTGKTTSTYYTFADPSPSYNAEQGWECPRCGRINAPWVRQCDCKRGWSITCDDSAVRDEWWKEYTTCDTDTFKIHPDDITYTGGSDYWDPMSHSYVNTTTHATNTIHNGKTNYKE